MAESQAESQATNMEESHDTKMEDLMYKYDLNISDCNRQVTDRHIDEISRSYCGEWRHLPSQLEMDEIIESDINRKPIAEDEKRREFFKKWKNRHGSRATYEKLIRALLRIRCLNDAESVCRLLQRAPAVSTSQSRSCIPATVSSAEGIGTRTG